MKISDAILPEFDQEMENTRKLLERVPDDKLDWKPHAKSMTLGRLAGHVAELANWGATAVTTEELNLAPEGKMLYKPTVATTAAENVALFEKNRAAARAAIGGASDEHLMKPWSLKAGDKTFFTMPRIAVVRSVMLNHTIHHRAQLGVYLRLLDVPVPGMYGPSADEQRPM